MISTAQFRITEFAGHAVGEPEEIRPFYDSQPMCLRDASRFAAALSYARSTYVRVTSDSPQETYQEWWLAGSLWNHANVPPIKGGGQ